MQQVLAKWLYSMRVCVQLIIRGQPSIVPLCTKNNTSDASQCAGRLLSGLQQWCSGWPSGPSDTTAPASSEYSYSANLQTITLKTTSQLHKLSAFTGCAFQTMSSSRSMFKVVHAGAPSYRCLLVCCLLIWNSLPQPFTSASSS